MHTHTQAQTHPKTGRPLPIWRSELRLQETARRGKEMFRPRSHFSLSSLGIYYLLCPLPPVWSRGEVGNAPRSRCKGQEGRVGSPTNGPSSSYLHGQEPGPPETDARGLSQSLRAGPISLACSVLPYSSPLRMAGSSG